jgi:hypothetical protein
MVDPLTPSSGLTSSWALIGVGVGLGVGDGDGVGVGVGTGDAVGVGGEALGYPYMGDVDGVVDPVLGVGDAAAT